MSGGETQGRNSALDFWFVMASRLLPILSILLIALFPAIVMGQSVADNAVSASPESVTAHGAWRFRQLRNDSPVFCRFKGPTECITHKLRVENASGDTLECTSRLSYEGVNNENLSSVTARTVILPRQIRDVVSDRAKPDVPLTGATVDCRTRPPRPMLDIPKECKFQVLEALPLEDFYPPTARRLSEQGPVELSFILAKAQGRASDIGLVGSSLSERLDEAAVKYVKSMKFSTPCPSTRYELRVMFKLDE